jgi:hypothetical protein
MFITCQECNTTFRLDERLLKTIGSAQRRTDVDGRGQNARL